MKEIFDINKEELREMAEGVKDEKIAEREAAIARGLEALDSKSLLEKTGPNAIEKLHISEAAQKILKNMDPAVVAAALDKLKILGIEPIGIMSTGRTGDAGPILELVGKKNDNGIESIELDGRQVKAMGKNQSEAGNAAADPV